MNARGAVASRRADDEVVDAAAILIIRGKEQGRLTPDDVQVAPPLEPPIAAAGGYVMYVPQDVVDQTWAELEDRVRAEFCAPLTAAGVALEARVLEGSAPIVLGHVARKVGTQVIVVGTRALHALGELLLSSTSHALTLHTAVPVIVGPRAAEVAVESPVAADAQAGG